MIDKEIIIRETIGVPRAEEFVRVGVPFAMGELKDLKGLLLTDSEGQVRPLQGSALKSWKDGSVKWLLCDFAATVPAFGTALHRLVSSLDKVRTSTGRIRVSPGGDAWQVDTGAGTFSIDTRVLRPFARVQEHGVDILCGDGGACILTVDGQVCHAPLIDSVELEDDGPVRAIVRLTGRLGVPGRENLWFCCRLHFFAGSMVVQVEFTVQNRRAARHPAGLWDLGDPGSFLFRELAFTLPLAEGIVTDIQCIPGIGVSPVAVAADSWLSIYQESSGGENWQSPNHRNRNGNIPLMQKGYCLETAGKRLAEGLRASPVVRCGSRNGGIAAALPFFWQEFPKELTADRCKLKVALFPGRFPDLHELQGGEQKTHIFYLDFAAGMDSLSWALAPLQPVVSAEVYHASAIFGDLPPGSEEDLVDRFVTSSEMLEKREVLDEYGWRNFGDLYADHEAVYHQRDASFVSHYNNQYDLCAGAYRKFFAGGDPQWAQVAADLARHVNDIDMYHTDQDREEYNRGLFWHTDHYIDAGLAAHRSFSREHLKSKDPRFCGGGPGAEHCYTTGLMLHYFQTGNPVFRQAVIDLAEWVLRSLRGPQTILAALKRGVRYISMWRAAKGRKVLFPRYPLTRGTGNAITACLDAFEIGGGRHFLDMAEELIRGAIHPKDDIAARDLLDAETAWSYTVFLVAVAKFLDRKRELEEFDFGYVHARSCLLAYAEWMLAHEYPYLEKPEILEYPNETWAAQDLRKSVILFNAARYAQPDRSEVLLQKGMYFYEAASVELLRHASSRFTRPLALILQNGWVGSRLEYEISHVAVSEQTICPHGNPIPKLSLAAVASRIVSDISEVIRQTNPTREVAWLKKRLLK